MRALLDSRMPNSNKKGHRFYSTTAGKEDPRRWIFLREETSLLLTKFDKNLQKILPKREKERKLNNIITEKKYRNAF